VTHLLSVQLENFVRTHNNVVSVRFLHTVGLAEHFITAITKAPLQAINTKLNVDDDMAGQYILFQLSVSLSTALQYSPNQTIVVA